MSTVRAVRFHELGGPEVMRLEEVPLSEPAEGEVRVRVQAIGLNRSEVNFRRGQYLEKVRSLPSGLGYEAAGIVDQLGEGVTHLAVGDEVSVLPTFPQSQYHTYAESTVVPASSLVPRPGVDAIAGAAVWMPFLTAYGGLVEVGRLRPGDHVVVTAATSSVGLAALQVARRIGAIPIATTNRTDRAPRLLAAGAEEVVVSGHDDIVGTVRNLTAGHGAELIFDAVAGAALEDLAQATASDGLILIHGSLSGEPSPMPGLQQMRPVHVRPYTVFEVLADRRRRERAVGYVAGGIGSGAFEPTIDKVFDFDDIVAAHRYLENGGNVGKVVVRVR